MPTSVLDLLREKQALLHSQLENTAASGADQQALPGEQQSMLDLQGAVGNQAVQRLIQRDGEASSLPPMPNYQLSAPSLTMPGWRRPSLLGDEHLHLDPEIEAEIRALQVRQMLEPAIVRPNLLQLPLPIGAAPGAPGPAATPGQPAPAPAQPPKGPETPRPGTPGDIAKAIMGLPAIDQALTQLQTMAAEQARRDWARLRLGEQIALVSVGVLIGGGALTAAGFDQDSRQFLLDQLNGRVIPVPGLPWLRTEFNNQGGGLMFGLHLDLGALLPATLGFGPGSSGAIGGPPQPAGGR
jgi:hypothetical protein